MGTPEQWVVTRPDGATHAFEDELSAWRFAAGLTWNDRACRVRDPAGNVFVVVHPHRDTVIQAVRPL